MKLLQELKKIAGELREEGDKAELTGVLTDKQLTYIYANRLFNLFVPESLGGLNLSLIEALRVEQLLAEIDGSLGWTVTLCSGANMFVGFLDQDIAQVLFNDSKVCFGGSGRPSGRAEITPEGYLISGKWQFATGAPHNTVFTANCEIYQNGRPVLNEVKEPTVSSFFFLREEVVIIHEWDTMGLKATASHSFEVNRLHVNKHRAFKIDPEYTVLKNPIFRYPFQQFAEVTLCVNSLGMTMRFLDLCNQIFDERYKCTATDFRELLPCRYLSNAKREMEHLQYHLYNLVETSWGQLNDTNSINPFILKEISVSSRQLVQKAQQWISLLYPYCGMKAAKPSEEINRVWRNLFTASQHSLLITPVVDN
ncbi:acyl-CoA dehydrogenase [Olivibacter sp. CPCC 100613]|uniref:acyl-CoA dehydrogenase n=1 Tax=Olivibacter sp. CPCC 100613 TaxID=3079931 RepID=UPI002FF9E3C8